MAQSPEKTTSTSLPDTKKLAGKTNNITLNGVTIFHIALVAIQLLAGGILTAAGKDDFQNINSRQAVGGTVIVCAGCQLGILLSQLYAPNAKKQA
eukprot:CAMPEP_0185769300 /NCGR_PEP_ID=MMETSP1174-20130828/53499_1 /TAXON_ID=35687 /ORGANISM="Dictyocha speculum, Strain CCMP1381" /LENGTH=94 /DNA_ID=CAMNT_0028454301 /DNA_START=71 /DNA_END=355 /DNA_ORIENTATION=-